MGHPLFDMGAYQVLYPDVAGSRVSPWLHFQVFGRAEGRSPHPYIDVEYLSASMPGVIRGDVVDSYVMLPEFWTLNPSPYIDVQAFMLSGRWDGRTHPLTQIVAQGMSAQWVQHRLMLIDNAGEFGGGSRAIAAATLLARQGSPSRVLELQVWAVSDLRVDTDLSAHDYTVVPGYFLGHSGNVMNLASDAILSPDESMISLGTEVVSVKSGLHITTSQLIVLAGSLNLRMISDFLTSANPDSVVSPSSRLQQCAVEEFIRKRSLTVRVLPYGKQVQVSATTVMMIPTGQRHEQPRIWTGVSDNDSLSTGFVVDVSRVTPVLDDPEVKRAVSNGAVMCVIRDDDLSPWASILGSRDVVACEPSLLEVLTAYFDEDVVQLLHVSSEGSK